MTTNRNDASAQEWADRPRRPAMGWLILGTILIALVMPGFAFLDREPSSLYFNPGMIAFVPMLSGSPFGRMFFGGAAARSVDERERRLFDQAIRRAYLAIFVIIMLVIAAMPFALSAGVIFYLTPRAWAQLGQAVLIVMATLPVAIAELTTPLPPKEEQ